MTLASRASIGAAVLLLNACGDSTCNDVGCIQGVILVATTSSGQPLSASAYTIGLNGQNPDFEFSCTVKPDEEPPCDDDDATVIVRGATLEIGSSRTPATIHLVVATETRLLLDEQISPEYKTVTTGNDSSKCQRACKNGGIHTVSFDDAS
jgi:hypothetical protein